MIRAFLDASALFSGAYSLSGGARELLQMSAREELELVVSEEVVEEAFRNVEKKAIGAVAEFHSILRDGNPHYVEPLPEHMEYTSDLTVAKDVHVVASAMSARCAYLVSHDRAHLVGNLAIEEATGIKIVTPGDLLAIIRSSEQIEAPSETHAQDKHDSEKTQ